MMKYTKIFIVVLSFAVCALGRAEQMTPQATDTKEKADKFTGVTTVTDAAGSVINKAEALLSGNLEMKMELNKNRSSKDDYTYNAIGQRIPKATATKTGSARHSE